MSVDGGICQCGASRHPLLYSVSRCLHESNSCLHPNPTFPRFALVLGSRPYGPFKRAACPKRRFRFIRWRARWRGRRRHAPSVACGACTVVSRLRASGTEGYAPWCALLGPRLRSAWFGLSRRAWPTALLGARAGAVSRSPIVVLPHSPPPQPTTQPSPRPLGAPCPVCSHPCRPRALPCGHPHPHTPSLLVGRKRVPTLPHPPLFLSPPFSSRRRAFHLGSLVFPLIPTLALSSSSPPANPAPPHHVALYQADAPAPPPPCPCSR